MEVSGFFAAQAVHRFGPFKHGHAADHDALFVRHLPLDSRILDS